MSSIVPMNSDAIHPDAYFALVDANNFYASCERAFNLSLQHRPIIVLSNNDGCVVARSNEAKALQIDMGIPFFKIKQLVKKHQVKVFSSNYALYGDMSERIVQILKAHCADIEVYSIDESFLKLSFFQATKKDLFDYALRLRSTILRGTGIPVSIGIAKTKTLAKLANHLAKKRSTEGVYILEAKQAVLATIDVSKIWGIGRASLKKLNRQGIQTVQQLSNLSEQAMKKEFGIVGLRLLKEIQGFPCYQLEDDITQRKSTMVSRSFKTDIYALDQLNEKVATYATRLGEKLRQYEQVTSTLTLYLWVNRYKNKRADGPCCFTRTLELPLATSNTNELITYALALTALLYQANTNYKKAGILASPLRPQQILQTNLFHSEAHTLRSQKLMTAMDGINKKLGRNTVHFAALGTGQQHLRPTANFKSPCYTTKWADLLKVR